MYCYYDSMQTSMLIINPKADLVMEENDKVLILGDIPITRCKDMINADCRNSQTLGNMSKMKKRSIAIKALDKKVKSRYKLINRASNILNLRERRRMRLRKKMGTKENVRIVYKVKWNDDEEEDSSSDEFDEMDMDEKSFEREAKVEDEEKEDLANELLDDDEEEEEEEVESNDRLVLNTIRVEVDEDKTLEGLEDVSPEPLKHV